MAQLRRLAALLGALAAAACSAPPEANPDATGEEAQTNRAGWTDVSRGIAGRAIGDGSGTATLVVYGGYGAHAEHAQSWADALVTARGEALGLGHVYASKGPQDALYHARELGNTALAARLAQSPPSALYVLAHSSGSFVAHELLSKLTPDVLAHTHYFNLDGGQDGLTLGIARGLGGLTFVYANDPGVGLSRNGAFMRALAPQYHGAKTFVVDAAASGCATSNCLHDTMITNRPHDPQTFDVADDYTDFAGRIVTAGYLTR
jgi:hypothetical protein